MPLWQKIIVWGVMIVLHAFLLSMVLLFLAVLPWIPPELKLAIFGLTTLFMVVKCDENVHEFIAGCEYQRRARAP